MVGDYGAIGLNPVDKCFLPKATHACVQPIFTVPVKEPSSSDRVSKCGHCGTEIDHSINGKGAGVLHIMIFYDCCHYLLLFLLFHLKKSVVLFIGEISYIYIECLFD